MVDSAGGETPVSTSDLIEIGLFGSDDDDGTARPIGEETPHPYRVGKRLLSTSPPSAPVARLDPRVLLFETDIEDNVIYIAPPEP